MATIVTPANSDSSSGVLNVVLVLFVVLVVVYLFFAFGLPALRQSGTPQINVPNQIDVNIKQPAK